MYTMTLEINQRCNLRCQYCYLGEKNGTKMSYETACKAIDRAFLYTKIHKDQTLWIDFIGGEPLLDFDMICKLVEYIYQKNAEVKYKLLFSLTTNATIFNEEILAFLLENEFAIKVSIDGDREVNDINRVDCSGDSVYDKILANLVYLKEFEQKSGRFVQVTNVITGNNYDKRDELVQMALELLKDHNNGFIEEDAILGLTGELSELAACYKKQKTFSKRERMENLKNAIPENSMQLSSEDMNRFDELFEIYKRNYRCAIGYTPKPFAGDLQALSCMDDHSPFVPVMKPGTEAFLSKCALGNLEVLPIGGNHLSCLMTPNVEGMANLLDGKGERV